MVLFDHECALKKYDRGQTIELFNKWEKVFLKDEFYEVIPAIKYRRRKLIKKEKYDNMSFIRKLAHNLTYLIKKIKKNKR